MVAVIDAAGESGWVSRGGEPFDEPLISCGQVVISMCWARGSRVSLFDNDLVFVQDLAIGFDARQPSADSCGWRRFDLAGRYVGRGSGWLRGRRLDSLASGARLVCGWQAQQRLAYRTGPSGRLTPACIS